MYTLSAIDEFQIPNLVTAVSSFGRDLTTANDDFQTHDTPADNVQNRILLQALGRDVSYTEIQANYGHDSFLLDVGEQTEIVRGFLRRMEPAAEFGALA